MQSQEHSSLGLADSGFRVDVDLREILMQGPKPAPLAPRGEPRSLPEPVFPRHAKKLGDVEPDPKFLPKNGNPYRTRVTIPMIRRALRGWLYPYIRSRVAPGQLHPIIAYLFTEWKCNLDCHYCWAFDNRVGGMTEDTARRSIDWLHETGCRVLALMGGEVLLRPHFVHKVAYYAAKKGFWVYVPTNGRLMRKEVIDRLGDAGVEACNLCTTECVVALSAVRAVNEYSKCGRCNICPAYFNISSAVNELGQPSEKLCPRDAIARKPIGKVDPEDPANNFYEYIIDEEKCDGCGKCVIKCKEPLGLGSITLRIRYDRCVNCNECAILRACPKNALVQLPIGEALQPAEAKRPG